MDDPATWPSLTDQTDLGRALYGDDGYPMVAAWLAEQVGRIGDPAFARVFSDHITLPGVASGDFAHRHVCSVRGDLIGGIRFYSRDIARPFVEVVAHSFDDLAALGDCVGSEWSMFAPRFLRLRSRPGRIVGPTVVLDVSIHAARYRDMSRPDGRVRLAPFTDAQEAIDLVQRRYQHMAEHQHALARNVSPEDPAALRGWHDNGQLLAIGSTAPPSGPSPLPRARSGGSAATRSTKR